MSLGFLVLLISMSVAGQSRGPASPAAPASFEAADPRTRVWEPSGVTLALVRPGGSEGTESLEPASALAFQTPLSRLTANDAKAGDNFGWSVAIDSDHAIIGAPSADLTGRNEGAAYAFKRSGDTWTQIAKLTASDAADDDEFGGSVAMHGEYAIIGARFDDLNGTNEGSAYVFTRTGDAWTQTAKLTSSDAADGDLFGASVAIDGDHAIIGSFADDLAGTNEGSAYAFRRTGDTWTQIANLTASDAADGESFGWSVVIDGSHAIIGTFPFDESGPSRGAAYAFRHTGDTWTQTSKLTASDAMDFDLFGASVAIDGTYAIIGSFYDDPSGTNNGSAYAFERSGDTWTQTGKLTADDATDSDHFGWSVVMDGEYAVIGAFPYFQGVSKQGSAYVFRRTGDTWTQTSKLTASDAPGNATFGRAVAIDGDHVIVGAFSDDLSGSGEGAAYVFLK